MKVYLAIGSNSLDNAEKDIAKFDENYLFFINKRTKTDYRYWKDGYEKWKIVNYIISKL